MTYSIGGRSTRCSEIIDRKWFPLTNALGVYVVREVTLNDDLSTIEHRSLQNVVVTQAGPDDTPVLTLGWDEAHWLAAALTAACDATRELRVLGPGDLAPTPPADPADQTEPRRLG